MTAVAIDWLPDPPTLPDIGATAATSLDAVIAHEAVRRMNAEPGVLLTFAVAREVVRRELGLVAKEVR